ncbi:MAG: hypothetical protein M1812_002282 [Candelaria pacifica]|nr:MAG: hypothetical protein M1812_002282 [Candelaria pacifica]
MRSSTILTIATLLPLLQATTLFPRSSVIQYTCRGDPAIGDAKATYDHCKSGAECHCNGDLTVSCEFDSVPPTNACGDHGPNGAYCECNVVGTGGCKRAQRRDPSIKC